MGATVQFSVTALGKLNTLQLDCLIQGSSMRIFYYIAILIMPWFFTSSAISAEFEILWTDNPPLICKKNGELDCLAGLLLKNAAKVGNHTLKTFEIPWARAVIQLGKNPNSIFAATGRNSFSDPNLNFFFQIYSDNVFLFTLDQNKVCKDTDIGAIRHIVIRRGSPFDGYLTNKGFGGKIVQTDDWHQAVGMLERNRVGGMVLSNLIGMTNLVNLAGINESRINRYDVGEISWFLIGASGKPPSAELQSFKLLLKKEKEKPYFQKLLRDFGVRN